MIEVKEGCCLLLDFLQLSEINDILQLPNFIWENLTAQLPALITHFFMSQSVNVMQLA